MSCRPCLSAFHDRHVEILRRDRRLSAAFEKPEHVLRQRLKRSVARGGVRDSHRTHDSTALGAQTRCRGRAPHLPCLRDPLLARTGLCADSVLIDRLFERAARVAILLLARATRPSARCASGWRESSASDARSALSAQRRARRNEGRSQPRTRTARSCRTARPARVRDSWRRAQLERDRRSAPSKITLRCLRPVALGSCAAAR